MTTEPTYCPKCGSNKSIRGRFCGAYGAFFQPDDVKLFALPIIGGPACVELGVGFACFDCGHLWAYVSPEDLRRVVTKRGRKDLKARLLDNDGDES